jgi:tetratricopeptide (TPR) repeat protein
VNLGAGRPYKVDERLEDFISAYCNEKIGNNREAERLYNRVANNKIREDQNKSALFALQISALKRSERKEEAYKLIREAVSKDPENMYIQWIKAREMNGEPESLTNDIMELEMETSPINNTYLLVNELLTIIE